ncbi:MAG: isopentenyl phosphate kinase [Acidilobus sp.]
MTCRSAVVKLGGSAITVKSSPETINWDVLQLVSRTLGSYVSSGGRLAVVHGGGSFGHYAVAKLLQERGSLGPAEVAKVQREMLVLAMAVISELIDAGVPATLHAAHSMCVSSERCDVTPMVRDFESGLVPVTYGDTVLRGGVGEIVSGDFLAARLATTISADCLIYASDVKGVIGPSGDVLKIVRPGDPIGGLKGRGLDVTGGMMRKIREAASTTTGIVRIVRWDELGAALRGEEVGTLVVR